MNIYTPRQYVELFNLLFMSQLVRKLDKRFYALKGGCNTKENIFSMDFTIFKSQVISYLEPEDQPRFESSEVWDNIRLHIVEAFEEDES